MTISTNPSNTLNFRFLSFSAVKASHDTYKEFCAVVQANTYGLSRCMCLSDNPLNNVKSRTSTRAESKLKILFDYSHSLYYLSLFFSYLYCSLMNITEQRTDIQNIVSNERTAGKKQSWLKTIISILMAFDCHKSLCLSNFITRTRNTNIHSSKPTPKQLILRSICG